MLSVHRSLATNKTNRWGYWNNSASALQEQAPAMYTRKQSKQQFQILLELARRWTRCFHSHAGCHNHTLWPYKHKYCWGKANIREFWERKSSLIAPLLWQTSTPLAFPHCSTSNISEKVNGSGSFIHNLHIDVTRFENFNTYCLTKVGEHQCQWQADWGHKIWFDSEDRSETWKVWQPCLGAGGIVANSFSVQRRNWEIGRRKINCLMVLNLCGYASDRVTPTFVNSSTVHFFWAQTRKLGPS